MACFSDLFYMRNEAVRIRIHFLNGWSGEKLFPKIRTAELPFPGGASIFKTPMLEVPCSTLSLYIFIILLIGNFKIHEQVTAFHMITRWSTRSLTFLLLRRRCRFSCRLQVRLWCWRSWLQPWKDDFRCSRCPSDVQILINHTKYIYIYNYIYNYIYIL